jgi:hypothetical protein
MRRVVMPHTFQTPSLPFSSSSYDPDEEDMVGRKVWEQDSIGRVRGPARVATFLSDLLECYQSLRYPTAASKEVQYGS